MQVHQGTEALGAEEGRRIFEGFQSFFEWHLGKLNFLSSQPVTHSHIQICIICGIMWLFE